MRSDSLEHGHRMAGAIELVGGGQAGRTRPDDGHLLAGARSAADAASTQPSSNARSMIDDLDRLDRHRVVIDAEHARPFARRGTQPPGELREVVRRVQPVDRRPPPVAVDEIVPVGNQVAERTALVAERNAAVHAARALRLQFGVRQYGRYTSRQSWMRSSTGRVGCFFRLISMKPVILPMEASPAKSSYERQPLRTDVRSAA